MSAFVPLLRAVNQQFVATSPIYIHDLILKTQIDFHLKNIWLLPLIIKWDPNSTVF